MGLEKKIIIKKFGFSPSVLFGEKIADKTSFYTV